MGAGYDAPKFGPVEDDVDEFKLTVPTYYGDFCPREVSEGMRRDFDGPEAPVVIREAEGVRIVLGTHDYDDCDRPDVQIERHPNGWMIFLHPLGGSDACACVFFVDDGRSFLVKEFDYGPTPAIQIIEPGDDGPPEIHGSPDSDSPYVRPAAPARRTCMRCARTMGYTCDWHLGLCPTCADATDGDWYCRRCGRRDAFEAMGGTATDDPECCGEPCRRVDGEGE